ncbi:hypothetical protein vseg_004952 [Gypsophila vaccaria]
MVRKHGFQLPAHTFQVVAITVYCLLVVEFYVFLAPFLGGRIWEYVLLATYSPVALVVFILYARCTAINPADPGIMSKFDGQPGIEKHGASTKEVSGRLNGHETDGHSSPYSLSRSSTVASHLSKIGSAREVRNGNDHVQIVSKRSSCSVMGGILCVLFVHEDCRKEEQAVEEEEQGNREDALFCTLCNAEVRKFSKHCRSCDKCVDSFDHHCRWLNNCVGRKNYMTFISLMALSLLWLVIEAAIGLAVFIRCFTNKRSMETQIIDRLGNGFSRAPFAAVVAVCTAVSMVACVPLGELFCFHMLLMRKGMTTYEYVVAMRALSEAPPGGASDNDDLPNELYSPTGSTTTGFSGGSSLGLQYKGGWCTPPRVFVDYQEEVAPHLEPGMIPSTIDPDATGRSKVPKRPVKVSAWKLAKMDRNEALKAAAKARASSSVLLPVENRRLPEYSSSENMSIRSSMSTDVGPSKETKSDLRISSMRNSVPPSQGSRDEYETGTQSMSSVSSPSHVHESVTLSPLPRAHATNHLNVAGSAPWGNIVQPSSYKAVLQSVDSVPNFPPVLHEKNPEKERSTDPLLLPASTALLRDVKRTSVVWDQEAGRYVSVPATTNTRNTSSLQISNTNVDTSNHGRRPPSAIPQEEPSSSSRVPQQQSDKLMYSGESIFFGGPLIKIPGKDGVKSDRSSIFRRGQEPLAPNFSRETRFKRDGSSNQLPVFLPGGSAQNLSSSGVR